MGRLDCKFHLLMILAIAITTLTSTHSSRVFKLLYDGNERINGTYTRFQADTLMKCAVMCLEVNGCWVYTWDWQMKDCDLLDNLTSLVQIEPASPTLRTYYAQTIRGKRITIKQEYCKWLDCKSICQDMGGRLYLPEDNTISFLLHHLFKKDGLFIGMYRDPDDENTWYNMEGQIITDFLQWEDKQPNNNGGDQYYIMIRKGYLEDRDGDDLRHGLCEI